MQHKNTHRVIAAGFIAASLLIAAPPAQAAICLQCGTGWGGGNASTPTRPPSAPDIGIATSGVPGGTITATATWRPHNSQPGITGYRVRATRVDLFAPYLTMSSDTLNSTTSAVQPGSERSLSMTLPQTGIYTFQVQAINSVGSSPYSAESNRVTGQ